MMNEMTAQAEAADVAKLNSAADKVETVFPGSTAGAVVRTKRTPKPRKLREVAPGVSVAQTPEQVRAVKRVERDRKAAEKRAKAPAPVRAKKAPTKAPKAAKAPAAPSLSKSEAAKLVKAAVEAGKRVTADVAAVVDVRKLPLAVRPKPSSGQSGEALDLPWDDRKNADGTVTKGCSADQKRILSKLNGNPKEAREDFDYNALAIGGDKSETGSGARKDLLRVRNGMRNLVRGGWVEKRGRGLVRISTVGRSRMEKL